MLFHVSGLVISLSCISSILAPIVNALPPIDFDRSNLDKVDLISFDPDTANFANGKTVVQIGEIPNLKKAVNVALPKAGASSEDAIFNALPAVLKDLGVPTSKIASNTVKAAPLFDAALHALLTGQDLATYTPYGLAKRGLWDDIVGFFEDVGEGIACSAFAAGALPGYLATAAAFAVGNPSSLATSMDQNYFINALYGGIWKDNIRVTYKAWRPPGFGGASGTTYNTRVYIQHAQRDVSTISGFKSTTTLLLHEAAHVKQYKSLGYSLSVFGLKYLYDYCANGFSYNKIPYEKDAYAQEDDVNGLLIDSTGQLFFKFWKRQNLYSQLGYPIEKTYTTISTTPKRITQVRFEKAYLQVTDGPCYRILSNSDITAKNAANCVSNKQCPKGSVDWEIKIKARAPLPPPDYEPGPVTCNKALVDQQNAACKAKKSAWQAIDAARTWTCGVTGLPAVL